MPADEVEAGMPSSDFMVNDEADVNAQPMEQDMEQDQSFDTDFDAGVEADEKSDPKKYIQQLTGKLCTTLNKYNEDKPQPDSELCKYVAGMVIAQCVKGLDEKQSDEIIKKLTEKENDEESSQAITQQEDDVEQTQEPAQPQEVEPDMNEEKMVEKIVSDIVNSKKMSMPIGKAGYKNSPYILK